MQLTNPQKFADLFNAKVPGAYRQVTADDIQLLAECRLIKRYGFYDNTDLQTVIGILNYEQLREKRTQQEKIEASGDPPPCRLCGKPLSKQPEGKKGRPHEYCPVCEPLRGRGRYQKWRRKMKAARNPTVWLFVK